MSVAPPSQIEESPQDDVPQQPDPDKKEQLTIRDIVNLQETSFIVRIQPPGSESFELQVGSTSIIIIISSYLRLSISSSVHHFNMSVLHLQVSGQMLVAELRQVLMDHEITCHRTCFSLQLGGTTLDSLTELHSIQGIQNRALIKLVEGDCLYLCFKFYFSQSNVNTQTGSVNCVFHFIQTVEQVAGFVVKVRFRALLMTQSCCPLTSGCSTYF